MRKKILRMTLSSIGDFHFAQPEATGKLNPHFLLCSDTRRKHRTFYADECNANNARRMNRSVTRNCKSTSRKRNIAVIFIENLCNNV